MSDLLDLIIDTFPGNNDVGVPLQSNITITLDGLDYDEDSLKEGFFIEGPDTDQFVGPGLELASDNISQGDLDDFLQSPGYRGIVQGTITVSGIAGNTVITIDPDLPLAPQILYVVNLTSILNAAKEQIDGFVSFSFETGTGSIEVIPSTVSSSVLAAALPESVTVSTEDLKVVSTSPEDRDIEQLTTTNEIVITFNKEIDPDSVDTSMVTVITTPISDHPQASTSSLGDLVKTITVLGKTITIKI